MSDRPHNKDLEDLLKNFKTQKSEELDDFEREALEGFETLGSEEEVRDVKSKLDKRAYDELFAEKKGHKIYWFAAAGLFLVIGLSVFFILNNQQVEEKNVAYVQPVNDKQILKEEVTAIPTDEAVTPEPQNNKVTAETKTSPSLKNNSKKTEDAESKEGGGISSRAVLKPSFGKETSGENNAAMDKRDDDRQDNASGELSKQTAKDANFESGAVDMETKKLEEKNKREAEVNEKITDQLAYTETKSGDEEPRKGTKKSGANKSKEKAPAYKAAEDDAKTETPANTSVAANGAYDLKNNGNVSQTTTTPGAPAEQKAGSPSYNPQSVPKADEYNSPTNTCYYVGGVSDLVKDVRVKLNEQNVNKQFDAILNINEKKKVEKVIFLNVYDLTTTERDKVTKILKDLDKFNFYIQPNKKSLFEFKLLYKP